MYVYVLIVQQILYNYWMNIVHADRSGNVQYMKMLAYYNNFNVDTIIIDKLRQIRG